MDKKGKLATLAMGIVTAASLTSCKENKEEAKDKFPGYEKEWINFGPAKDAEAEKEKAIAKLAEIEKAGIPTVKKDKDGKVVEILRTIEETGNEEWNGDTVVTTYTFADPVYMSVHVAPHKDKIYENLNAEKDAVYLERQEKHHRAVDYSATPKRMKKGTRDMRPEITFVNSKVSKEIDAHGDTVVTTKERRQLLNKDIHSILFFEYEEVKQPVNAKLNAKMQSTRRGGRNG